MAAAQEPLPNSQQRSNNAKLGQLIFHDDIIEGLRSVFDRYHAPLTLEEFLRSKIEILHSLQDSELVSPGEWKLLFPDDGLPSSQNMEVHLLLVLLQNICGLPKPSTGLDKPPADENNLFPGNVAKLNTLISEVARQTTLFGVENMCFHFYWSEITNVVSTLGFELPLSCEGLKHRPMDKDDEDKYIRLLVEWTMRTIPNQDVAAHFQETAENLNAVIQRQDETKLQLKDSKVQFTWSKSSIIGTGCIGTKVYHGQLTSNSQKVAVKKMFKGVFDMDEAVKLRRCKHPNIIHCFAIHEEEDFFYLALELGEKTLRHCTNENMFDSNDGNLSIEKCFVEVASGVAYLHENNICHRDIKPDNILLMAKNDEYSFQRFVLADLNCARDVPSGETISTQSRFGTPGWMAPEVCGVGCRQTLKVDIFALGCVYYYTITKKHPYGGDGETLTERQNNINKRQSPLNYMKHFESYKHFSELLLRMINADVEKRPAASEVLEHLESSKKQKAGNLLDENDELEELSLNDAVLPETVVTKQALMADRVIRRKNSSVNIKTEALNDEDYTIINSVSNTEGMDMGGQVSDCSTSNKGLILRGHKDEVTVCAWNPVQDILASGADDGTARLWSLNDSVLRQTKVLRHHFKDVENAKHYLKEVTSMEWNPEGTLLATGSGDFKARIWNSEGQLVNTLKEHHDCITRITWNKAGNYLLSGGNDTVSYVWEASSWEVKQKFAFHLYGFTVDVDWQNSDTFASCSTDKMIHLCRLGLENPVKSFQGHTKNVNAIRWDPSGTLLASCSDDMSVKIWSVKHDTCVHDLQGHKSDVCAIGWSPTGPASSNPNGSLLLASASSMVCLWDVERGQCLLTLDKHDDTVFGLSFSPDGKYIATGSCDKYMYIWSTQTGSLVQTYQGNGVIYDVQWSPRGDKVAACCSDKTVCILDVRALS